MSKLELEDMPKNIQYPLMLLDEAFGGCVRTIKNYPNEKDAMLGKVGELYEKFKRRIVEEVDQK